MSTLGGIALFASAAIALVHCGSGASTSDSQAPVIATSSGSFTVDCTLTKTVNGQAITGYAEGTFQVDKDGVTLIPGGKVTVSIGGRKKNNYDLVVKSGTVTDADAEILDLVATRQVASRHEI
jgi:hypothetical protein